MKNIEPRIHALSHQTNNSHDSPCCLASTSSQRLSCRPPPSFAQLCALGPHPPCPFLLKSPRRQLPFSAVLLFLTSAPRVSLLPMLMIRMARRPLRNLPIGELPSAVLACRAKDVHRISPIVHPHEKILGSPDWSCERVMPPFSSFVLDTSLYVTCAKDGTGQL